MSQVPRDYNELERMDKASWDTVLDELKAEHKGVGDALAAWMADHKDHADCGIRWYVPDGTNAWYAHGRCNQCRVDSRMHRVGDDPPHDPDPALIRFRSRRNA